MTKLISKQKIIETKDYSIDLKIYNFQFKHEKDSTEFSYIIDIDIYNSLNIIRLYITHAHIETKLKFINKKTKLKSEKSLNCIEEFNLEEIQYDLIQIKPQSCYIQKKIENLQKPLKSFIQKFNINSLNKLNTKKPFYEDYIEIFTEPTIQNNVLYYTYHPDDEFNESELENKYEDYHKNRHSTYVHFKIQNDILYYKTIFRKIHTIGYPIHIPGTDKIEGSKKLNKKQMEIIKQSDPNKIKTFLNNIFWKKINKNLPNPFKNPYEEYITHYSKWKKGTQEELDSLIKAIFISSSSIAFKKAQIEDIKIQILSDVKDQKKLNDMKIYIDLKQNLEYKNSKTKEEIQKDKNHFVEKINKMIFENFYFVGWTTDVHSFYDKRRLKAYEKQPIRIYYDIENIQPHTHIDAHIKLKKYLEKKYPEKNATETIKELKNLFQKILE